MRLGQAAFDTLFGALLLIVAGWGALQCFWPAKLRALRDRLPRGYNPDAPLGRMMERAQERELGLLSRLSGLILFLLMLFILGWWLLGHPAI
jgi:hypothetical protein